MSISKGWCQTESPSLSFLLWVTVLGFVVGCSTDQPCTICLVACHLASISYSFTNYETQYLFLIVWRGKGPLEVSCN